MSLMWAFPLLISTVIMISISLRKKKNQKTTPMYFHHHICQPPSSIHICCSFPFDNLEKLSLLLGKANTSVYAGYPIPLAYRVSLPLYWKTSPATSSANFFFYRPQVNFWVFATPHLSRGKLGNANSHILLPYWWCHIFYSATGIPCSWEIPPVGWSPPSVSNSRQGENVPAPVCTLNLCNTYSPQFGPEGREIVLLRYMSDCLLTSLRCSSLPLRWLRRDMLLTLCLTWNPPVSFPSSYQWILRPSRPRQRSIEGVNVLNALRVKLYEHYGTIEN